MQQEGNFFVYRLFGVNETVAEKPVGKGVNGIDVGVDFVKFGFRRRLSCMPFGFPDFFVEVVKQSVVHGVVYD